MSQRRVSHRSQALHDQQLPQVNDSLIQATPSQHSQKSTAQQQARNSSRPSTAKKQKLEETNQLLPDISLNPRRPGSAVKPSQEALKKASNLDIQSVHSNTLVVAADAEKNFSRRESESKRLDSLQKTLQQRSENIKDYERKTNLKQRPSQMNDDLRQINTETDLRRDQVDLPPPLQNAFMQSSEHFGNLSDTNIDLHHQGIPDQEASQIGGSHKKNINVNNFAPQVRETSSQKPNQRNSQNLTQANIQIKTQPMKKRKNHLNQFKEKNMSDKEVLDFLNNFCQQRVNLHNMNTPNDFDSTDNLDSFLMSMLSVNQDGLIAIDSEGMENIHLATGTRTPYCRSILMSMIEFQNKEVVFSDALEFFSESMNKMLQLSTENAQKRELIESLESIKQDLTIKMFDYQKKLTDTSTALLKLRQTEFEQAKILAAVKKQLDHKKAECESLTYMIKNNVKTNENVPIQTEGSESAGKTSLKSLIKSKPQSERMGVIEEQQDLQVPADLPPQNQNVSILQTQIQKLQIENRQCMDRINEMQISHDNKDRLIQHLEHNISEMLVEREKNVIRLKSEIVVLQNKLTEGEESFKSRLMQMKLRVEVDEKAKVKRNTEALQEQLDTCNRQKQDLTQKIERLQDDYQTLGQEFQNYRKEKVLQESVRESYLKEIESKYKTLSEQYSEAQHSMISKLDLITSQSLQKQNENEVLFLRLKYLRQITDTLKRQKQFILETLQKSKQDLERAMQQLEEAMINQNKSKSYLISVEKSIKQTKDMSDLGSQALLNIENIVKFLKVEKMYELVFDVEQPTPWQEDAGGQEHLETLNSKQSDRIKVEKRAQEAKVGVVQGMLDSLRTLGEIPVQFRAKQPGQDAVQQQAEVGGQKSTAKKNQSLIIKNEEYYLEHCPVELCSILLKFIVQQLCQIEVVQSVEQIPFQISRLLFLANSKSDLQIERDLFDQYLLESKRILDDEIAHMSEQISTLHQLKDVQSKQQQSPQKEQPVSEQREVKQTASYNVLSMKAFESEPQPSAKTSQAQRDNLKPQIPDNHDQELQRLQLECQQQQLLVKELKLRQRDVQIGLATEIVVLQERLELQVQEHEAEVASKEQQWRQEADAMRQGCAQREQALLAQVQVLMEKVQAIEAVQPAQVQTQKTPGGAFAERAKQIMEEQRDSQEFLRSKRSIQSLLEGMENDHAQQIQELQSQFDTYKSNIATYIEVRESNRNTISIVFDANETNAQMINENILKLYLSKIYQVEPQMFRLLSSQNFCKVSLQESKVKKQKDELVMTKILMEVVEPKDKLEAKSAQLRADINDGSSLLYDLMPSYVCFNLGQSGLATKNKLSQCRLLQKQGVTIDSIEYIVTLLRHREDPFVFMAIAINMQTGEEHVLELQRRDIFTLIKGDISLLESSTDSEEVQQLILDNLVLLHNDLEGTKSLSCEQKVYFNTVMQSTMASRASTTLMQTQKGEKGQLKKFEIGIRESPLKNSIYSLSTVRDHNLTADKRHFNQTKLQASLFRYEKDCQTDFQMSLLYEAFQLVFQTLQKVSNAVELHIRCEQSTDSNTLKLSFQDTRSLKMIQFCVLAPQSSIPILNHDSDEDIQEQFLAQEYNQEQYFVHSQCLMLDESCHTVLCSVERLRNQGLLIKLHDLKNQQSSEIALYQKSNGQMGRLPQGQSTHQEQPNKIFRQMVYDLTLNTVATEDLQQNQTVQQSLIMAEDQLLSESKDPQLAEQYLLDEVLKRTHTQVNKLTSKVIVLEALKSESNPYSRHSTSIETFKQLQERGLLLYRDVQYVRVSESLAVDDQGSQQSTSIPMGDNCRAIMTLVSLHIKDIYINIEVFLYKHQKISVTSSVQVDQLFVGDPRDLNHQMRSKFIKQFLEKLFVIEIDGRFEMKIEQDSQPITQILSQIIEENGCLPGQEDSHQAVAARNRAIMTRNYEEKTREFQIEKVGYLQSGRAQFFQEYVTIEEQGHVFELNIYVLLKKEKKQAKSNQKRLNTFGKTQLQIETQKLEQFIDDWCEFECIYLETADPVTKDPITTFIDKKRLVQILVKDMTIDWASIITNWRQKLIPYIKHCIQIDSSVAKITIRNAIDISNLVISHCQSIYGSKIASREDQAIIETFAEECQELLEKQMVLNQEVDFAEFSYDVKMFRISKKRSLTTAQRDQQQHNVQEQMGGVVTFAYHIEIFNINEPDRIYKYRMPLSHENSNDPLSFTSEVFNLVHYEPTDLSEKSTDRAPKQQEQPSRQKQLVQRYVDNNLVLVVQLNKFPALLSLMLIEASSSLSWSCTYEPCSEITSAGAFCMLDSQSQEKFFNSVYDQLLAPSDQVFVSDNEVTEHADWNALEDTVPVELLPNISLDNSLSFIILKHRGTLKVSIYDREQKALVNMRQQPHKALNEVRDKQMDSIDDNLPIDKPFDLQDLHGAFSNDHDCEPQNPVVDKVDIRVKNVFANHLITKALLTNEKRVYVTRVVTSQTRIHVSVQDLSTMAVIAAFSLRHQTQRIADLPQQNNITQMHQVKQHVLQALTQLNTNHIAKKMFRLHEQWLKTSKLQQSATAQDKQIISPNEKTLTLHRRVFYDEQREDLIIVTADIIVNAQTLTSSLLLPADVNSLSFRIELPERKISSKLVMPLAECVQNPADLPGLNRRDIARLKALARQLLDERCELRVKAVDQANAYELHFLGAGQVKSPQSSIISAARQ